MPRHVNFMGLLFGLLGLLSHTTAAQPEPKCTVFVVGGTGRGTAQQLVQTLQTVRQQADELGGASTLVVLDDLGRTLPTAPGLVPVSAAQSALLAQLHSFPGRLVVVPGAYSATRDARLVELLDSPVGRPGAVVLGVGCPGPAEIMLNSKHTLVVLNTTWWLRPPAAVPAALPPACEAQTPASVLSALNDILRRNQGRHVLLVGQASLARAAWSLPLFPNPSYQMLRRSLRGTLEHYPELTYIGGQSHRRARYDEENTLHYFVSSATAPHQEAGLPTLTAAHQEEDGFTRLDYGSNGQVKVSYWLPDAGTPRGQVVAEQHWVDPTIARAETADSLARPALPASALVRASTLYGAGALKTWLQGANYRREWQQLLRVPVLDLATAHGGLHPTKTGGGLQTKSLHLQAAGGAEFVLRSVEKNTDASVPNFLHRTFAATIVQDQISAAHPYAALLVPPLAEAAGVAHTNPELVLLADDPRLGIYRRDFAGTLGLLEARDPTPPRSFTGRPLAKRYSTFEVLAQLQASARNRIDQRALLRARLLDMVIADWDRHEDQWRWLAYPRPGGGLLFRALPRDRDQTLFVNEGVLPRMASAEYLLPRLQGFGYDFRNVNSFNYQARYFDRSFLTELSRTDWQALADSVQASLTDSVLAAGLRQWPDSIARLSGPLVLAKLKAHRARLPVWADEYYRFLAQAVDVVGSDDPEEFAVVRQDEVHTQVTVYARTPAGERGAVRYHRTFITSETTEIRLYGQGGADLFHVSVRVHRGPAIRIVGGEGVDTLRDSSDVRTGRRKVTAYDTPAGLIATARGPDTKLRLTSNPAVNQYIWAAFQYPYTAPFYPWGYSRDDGLFVGVGLLLKRAGFRKEPWAATHRFGGNLALRTGAFSFTYEGLLTQVVGPFDLQLRAMVQAPNYVRSFYGLGNDTRLLPDEPTSAPYYRVRFRNLAAAALLRRAVGAHGHAYGGVAYQNVRVEGTEGHILLQSNDERLRPDDLFATKDYLGLQVGYEFASREVAAELPQGVQWRTNLLALRPLSAAARPLTQLTSSLALYRSFVFPLRLTLATRFGGTATGGNYEFFQVATLGGLENLRGYGRTRFAGRYGAYNNTEARLQLGHFRTYLLPATFGLLAFHDVGRVWQLGEASRTWHRGYGPGLWLAPTPPVIIAAMYGISSEDKMLLVRLGFFF